MLPEPKRIGLLLRKIFGNVPMRLLIGFVALVWVLDALATPFGQGTKLTGVQAIGTVVALFAVYAAVVLLLEGRRLTELDWRAALPHLGLGVLLAAFVSSPHILRLLTSPTAEPLMLSGALGFLLAASVTAVAEELIFRGVLLRISEEWLGSIAALLFSSIIFSLLHTAEIRGDTFIAGLSLGSCFLLTRKLWLSIGGHFAHNAILEILTNGQSKQLEAAGGSVWSVIGLGLPSLLVTAVFLTWAYRRGRLKGPFWRRRKRDEGALPPGPAKIRRHGAHTQA